MTRLLAALLVLSPTTARALDCETVTYTVGQPLTPDAAECLRRAVVRCELDRDTCEARRAQQQARADACEATAAITCPPAPLPVVPVLVAFVAGVVATVALVLSAR